MNLTDIFGIVFVYMNLRGTNRSTRLESVCHYHLLIYFFGGFLGKSREKRFEAGRTVYAVFRCGLLIFNENI